MDAMRRFWLQVWYRTLTSPYVIVATGSVIALLLVATSIVVLFQTREDAVVRVKESSRNLGIIAEQDIERNFELYAGSLQAVVDGLSSPGVMSLPWKLRHEVLFGHAIKASYVGSIIVLDAQGNVIIDASSEVPRAGNFANREYFTAQRDNPKLGLYISKPFVTVFRRTEDVVLSRRISNPDGSFAGVAALGIDLEYFHRLFSHLQVGPLGSVALIGRDGTMYMRHPYSASVIGRDLSRAHTFRQFLTAREGTFFDESVLDGTRRLYYFKNFAHLPFVIMVAEAQPDIYAAWSRHAIQIGALVIALAVGFVVLSMLMSTQLRRRLRTEQELMLLARTDGLTGLSNRRMLDETLENEWARARRAHAVLALLFIDIDWFKPYNDTYGHQAGDRALAAVARTIGESIRRPGDCAARYGGEEFVVVLPQTSIEGATALAEKIRAAVGELAIEHTSSEYGHVTVSIGVAAWAPERGSTISCIMRAADQALNDAKSAGRNRVAVSGEHAAHAA